MSAAAVVTRVCAHGVDEKACPPAAATDHQRARVIACFPEQGWSLLCNGVIAFHDGGELSPTGRAVPAQRGPAPHSPA